VDYERNASRAKLAPGANTMTEIVSPFAQFFGTDGAPLNNGAIFIGTAYLDAQSNPIPVYWDDALTIPAAQPIRTLNGYTVRNGTPARIFCDAANFSMTVQTSTGRTVWSVQDANSETKTSDMIFQDFAASDGSSLVGFLQSGAGADARTVQDKLRDVLHVRDFNIRPENADNAAAFANLAAEVQARGGGTILFPAGQTYDVFTSSFSAPVSTLMAFSGLKGVRILMNGSRIRTTRDWVSAAATCRMFQFTDCEDVDLEFSALQATGTTTDMFTTGHIGAYFINNCKRVRVRGRCEGGRSGVEVVRGAGFSFANYAEGFDIDLETQNVFYPVAFERNGRSAQIKLIAKSAGRSLFLANASNIRADVWTDNTVGYDDIVLSASCAPGEGIINNACDNIDIKVTHRPPFAATSALSALVTLVYQQMDSVNETVPGRFSNISVKFDCDYQGNANLVPAKFFYAATQKFGSVNATAPTTHYMVNIKVSGNAIFSPSGSAILVDFLRDGNAALVGSAGIGNIAFEDWAVTGGSGAQSFEIQVNVVDFNLALKNINNPNGAINFAGTLPVGILDASQGVIASNFRSSGSNANGRYRRLPDGRMRQWGTAASVPAVANTTVTLPLSFRDNAARPQLQSATSGATDTLNLGSVLSSSFAINRPGGSFAIDVAWEAEGDV
jgi:hypothetical protein